MAAGRSTTLPAMKAPTRRRATKPPPSAANGPSLHPSYRSKPIWLPVRRCMRRPAHNVMDAPPVAWRVFPSLAGHDAGYISTRLMQYRAGETVGPNSPLMKPVAATLSDQDIANLAAFISTEFQ